MISTWLIILFALAGFGISVYIQRKTSHKKALVCPVGGSCDFVTTSRYAKTFGIPNVFLGMLYYATMGVLYAVHEWFYPFPDEVMSLALFASALALTFSVYLVFVQAFILKKWCSWCVASALLTFGIFFFAFF